MAGQEANPFPTDLSWVLLREGGSYELQKLFMCSIVFLKFQCPNQMLYQDWRSEISFKDLSSNVFICLLKKKKYSSHLLLNQNIWQPFLSHYCPQRSLL